MTESVKRFGIPLPAGKSWDDPMPIVLTRREAWLCTTALLNAGSALLAELPDADPDSDAEIRGVILEYGNLGIKLANSVDPLGRPVQWVDES
jgi:hypothetical protein